MPINHISRRRAVFAFGCLLASGAAGQEAERRPRRPLIVVLRRGRKRECACFFVRRQMTKGVITGAKIAITASPRAASQPKQRQPHSAAENVLYSNWVVGAPLFVAYRVACIAHAQQQHTKQTQSQLHSPPKRPFTACRSVSSDNVYMYGKWITTPTFNSHHFKRYSWQLNIKIEALYFTSHYA